MVDVVMDQGFFCTANRALDCLELLCDLQTRALPFEHGEDALEVAFGPL